MTKKLFPSESAIIAAQTRWLWNYFGSNSFDPHPLPPRYMPKHERWRVKQASQHTDRPHRQGRFASNQKRKCGENKLKTAKRAKCKKRVNAIFTR